MYKKFTLKKLLISKMNFSLYLNVLFFLLVASLTFAQFHLDSIGGKKYSVSSRQSKMASQTDNDFENVTKPNTNIIKVKPLKNSTQIGF